MCYEIEIIPRDVMYFRDARPIGASADGSGGNWPLPSTMHSAMMSALHTRFKQQISQWESKHIHLSEHEKNNNKIAKSSFQFGGLKTWGPFPKTAANNMIYLPTPADLLPSNNTNYQVAGVMQPVDISLGKSNLPKPVKYPVTSTTKPSKKELGQWLSIEQFQKYLDDDIAGLITTPTKDLYQTETRPGIAINAETNTTEDGKFYSAEYLRLKKNISMVAFTHCEAKKYQNNNSKDLFQEFFTDSNRSAFIFGGQRGVAWLESVRTKKTTPLSIPPSKTTAIHIKWVLISPAYFTNGWIPGFIEQDSGKVMLKEKIERSTMTRKQWREKLQTTPPIGAKLVAARIPKAIPTSGWKIDKDGNGAGGAAKASKLLVPAGSVYYFECNNQQEAKKLIDSLHGQTKSDHLGEQGFGLGLCGTWKLITI